MTDLQPVAPGKVPDHILRSKRRNLNAAAHAGVFASFAVIGIRGARWWIKYGGTTTMLTDSPGFDAKGKELPKQPVRSIDVIIVGASPVLSKQYWEDQFQQDAANPPDCYSVSGIAPESNSPKKQSPTCAACRHNVWGSAITQGGRKAKRCQDNKRIAVVPYGDVQNESNGGPMLLRIPPASLKIFDQYASKLDRFGLDVSEVVTRMSFNPDVTHPQIMFEDLGVIPEEIWPDVQEQLDADATRRILEAGALEMPQEVAPPQPHQMVQEAPEVALEAAPPLPPPPVAQPVPLRPAPPPPMAAPMRPVAPRPSPFGRPAVVAQPVQPKPEPPPPPPPAPEPPKPAAAVAPMPAPTPKTTPTVVQGAPSDLQNVIDRLLEDDDE